MHKPVIPHIQPAPKNRPFLLRLIRARESWLNVFTEEAYTKDRLESRILNTNFRLENRTEKIRDILGRDMASFPKHALTEWLLQPLIGHASFSINGDRWKQSRNKLESALRRLNDKRTEEAIDNAIDRIDSQIAERISIGKSTINVSRLMNSYASDVITSLIFSQRFSRHEMDIIYRSFQAYQFRAARAGLAVLLGLPKRLVAGYLKTPAMSIRAIIDQKIAERLLTNAQPAEGTQDLLQIMIDSNQFSKTEITDQISMLYLAGHETSATSLAMCLYLLGEHEAHQNNARQNIKAAKLVGKRTNDSLAVFNETLRLYPPIPILIREQHTPEDTSKPQCPMRSLIAISPWVLHRHKTYWHEADDFDPGRFLRAQSGQQFECFIPFGAGPRKCPGASLAMKEATKLLDHILGQYALTSNRDTNIRLLGRLTLKSRSDLQVRFAQLNSQTSAGTSMRLNPEDECQTVEQ